VRPKQADTRVIYDSIDFSELIYPLRNSIGNALQLRDVEGRDQQLIAVGERIVAITFQSRARKCAAVDLPKPEEQLGDKE
jgi:hypothetical protein